MPINILQKLAAEPANSRPPDSLVTLTEDGRQVAILQPTGEQVACVKLQNIRTMLDCVAVTTLGVSVSLGELVSTSGSPLDDRVPRDLSK